MLTKPYYSCNLNHISQPFGVNPNNLQPKGHLGTDFAFFGCYGTFLVAPEDVKIKLVIDSETFDFEKFPENLSKGYGVLMTSLANPDMDYLFWHLLPNIPVRKEDTLMRGDVVGQIGNSGMVFVGGQLVPIEHRTKPPYPGTHLHAEARLNNKYVDIVPLIDFSLPVERVKGEWIAKVLAQISRFFK